MGTETVARPASSIKSWACGVNSGFPFGSHFSEALMTCSGVLGKQKILSILQTI